MQIETILQIASICFRISIGVFLIGAILTVWLYRKLNIREIYLIRSGKAKRRLIGELEEHNKETGKLRDIIDLDFTTGNLRKVSRKKERKTEETNSETQFKRGQHSGNTGAFNTPSEEMSKQKDDAEEHMTSDAGETVKLNDFISADYDSRIGTVYQSEKSGELAATAPSEPTVPVNIISSELIIHTNEVIPI